MCRVRICWALTIEAGNERKHRCLELLFAPRSLCPARSFATDTRHSSRRCRDARFLAGSRAGIAGNNVCRPALWKPFVCAVARYSIAATEFGEEGCVTELLLRDANINAPPRSSAVLAVSPRSITRLNAASMVTTARCEFCSKLCGISLCLAGSIARRFLGSGHVEALRRSGFGADDTHRFSPNISQKWPNRTSEAM